MRNCNSLKSIDIPNSVVKIGSYAFVCCPSLKSIRIPNSVTEIEEVPFIECESLTKIYMSSDYSGMRYFPKNVEIIEY